MRELVGPGLEYLEKYRSWALANPNLVKDIEELNTTNNLIILT